MWAATQEGAGEQADELWLGRLVMDTVRGAVGVMNGLRHEHDVPGGPSQGAASYATLPEYTHNDDWQQLGSRAVTSWLGSLTDLKAEEEPCLSRVHGGDRWGLPGWTLQSYSRNDEQDVGLPRHFGKARNTPEARHWSDGHLRVSTTGWTGARDALRPLVDSTMQAWGTR